MTSDWDGLSVTEVGDGPGVLWLHGYTMRSDVWQPLWGKMPGWRHVGLDLPWHGASRGLRDGETLAMLADSVVAYTASASVSHVVALSFGTILATEMAVRHPDACDSWTLAAPSLAGMPHEPAVTRRYLDLYEMYRTIRRRTAYDAAMDGQSTGDLRGNQRPAKRARADASSRRPAPVA